MGWCYLHRALGHFSTLPHTNFCPCQSTFLYKPCQSSANAKARLVWIIWACTISMIFAVLPLPFVFRTIRISNFACSDFRGYYYCFFSSKSSNQQNFPSPWATPFWNSPIYLLLSGNISCPKQMNYAGVGKKAQTEKWWGHQLPFPCLRPLNDRSPMYWPTVTTMEMMNDPF